jgi:RNA polymerase sigma factor (sigma-70 family)
MNAHRSNKLSDPATDAVLSGLVRQYRDRLVRHATRIVHDPDHAADLVQEAFMRALREPRLVDADFRAGAWLYRVTTNLSLNSLRDRRRRDEIVADLPVPRCAAAHQDEAVLDSELAAQIETALSALSEPHREILKERFYADLSYQEIADSLGLRLGTVMSRLSRAKGALEGVLAGHALSEA